MPMMMLISKTCKCCGAVVPVCLRIRSQICTIITVRLKHVRPLLTAILGTCAPSLRSVNSTKMLWLVALAGVASAAAAQSLVEFTATRLRVEYAQNPISIDTPTPKFSYALSHPQRGQYQTAYQIQVSKVDGSSSWDSGGLFDDEVAPVSWRRLLACRADLNAL